MVLRGEKIMQWHPKCKTAGRAALVLALSSQIYALTPAPAGAQRSPNVVSAQCGGQENVVVRLGFSFSCNCSVREREGTRAWSFFAEPVVTGVERDAPAAGHLRSGDAIIAVNGQLVTTTRGGAEFAELERGIPVSLRLLRGGKLLTADVHPVTACRARDVAAAVAPRAERPRPPAILDQGARITEAYLGFGIRARASAQRPANGPVEWHFYEPPTVDQVAPNGPADRAGLEQGDTLTHVDGQSLITQEGGRRFGAIRAGQPVRLGYRRLGTFRTTTLHPISRPAARILGIVYGLQGLGGNDDESFSGRIDDVTVEVTGPAAIERLSDRILVRTHDGAVTVVIRTDRGEGGRN
jgi:hypothetical protein